jgi:hypothetical protein
MQAWGSMSVFEECVGVVVVVCVAGVFHGGVGGGRVFRGNGVAGRQQV